MPSKLGKSVAAAVMILAAVAFVPEVIAEQNAARAEEEVRAAVAQLTKTYGANDINGYFALFSPSFTWWGPGGRSDKETYRKFWTENVKTTGGLSAAETSDLSIQASPSGDLAIASYLLTVTQNNPSETRPPKRVWQMSPTWIKQNGQWLIVHLHFQEGPRPGAGSQN